MTALWRLRRFTVGLRGMLLFALIISGVAGYLNMRSLAGIQPLLEHLFGQLASGTDAQKAATIAELLRRAWIFLGIVALAACCNALSLYMGDYLGQQVLFRLRQRIFDHLQGLSLAFFERRRTGELISRVNNDTMVLQRALGTDLFKIIVGPLTVIFLTVKLVLISWRLSLTLCVTIPLLFLISAIMGRYTRRYATRVQRKIADLTAVSQESFSAMRVIKIFGLERQSQDRYEREALGVYRAEMKTALVKALALPQMYVAIGLATSATLVLGGYEIMHRTLTPDALVLFLFLLEASAAQMNATARLYLQLQNAEAAATRTLAVLDERSEVTDAPDAITLERLEGRVTFENVSFGYGGEEMVLKDFSLDIQPGEVVALVGPSGAGKSTVANLVARLYDVELGRVLLDGRDVRSLKQQSFKRFMGIVPQETILFGTSIRENIGYGREGATEEEILAASRAANAHDFIMGLPEQYETQVGERGALLSGGQRQRVAIARAFLRDPRVLILDEATSALDTESEKAVHAALTTLLQGRTAIIIAHRLSTIKTADRIVVLAEGRIVEQGTHEALLASDGLYRRLYESSELVGQATPSLVADSPTVAPADFPGPADAPDDAHSAE